MPNSLRGCFSMMICYLRELETYNLHWRAWIQWKWARFEIRYIQDKEKKKNERRRKKKKKSYHLWEMIRMKKRNIVQIQIGYFIRSNRLTEWNLHRFSSSTCVYALVLSLSLFLSLCCLRFNTKSSNVTNYSSLKQAAKKHYPSFGHMFYIKSSCSPTDIIVILSFSKKKRGSILYNILRI